MKRAAALVVIGLIAVGGAGCVLVQDPARYEIPAVLPVEEICPRLVELTCGAHFECCEPPFMIERAECEAQTTTACEASLDLWARDERTGYDGAQASVLFRRAYDELQMCAPEFLFALSARGGLRAMFTGTVEPGGSCQPDRLMAETFDTAAFFSCIGEENACLIAGLGVPPPFTCQPVRTEGGQCFSSIDCADGLYCARPTDLPGDCRARKSMGQLCAASEECQSLMCYANQCAALTRANAYGCER